MTTPAQVSPAERRSHLLRVFLLAWLAVSTGFLAVQSALAATLEFGKDIPLLPFAVLLALLTAAGWIYVWLRPVSANVLPAALFVMLCIFFSVLVYAVPTWPLLLGAGLTLGAAMYWTANQAAVRGLRVVYAAALAAGAALLAKAISLDWDGVSLSRIQPPRTLVWTPVLSLAALLVGVIVSMAASSRTRRNGLERIDGSGWFLWRAIAIAAILLHVFALSYLMTAKTSALYTPTYDFGIFAQMFGSMLRNGQPLTTLERSRELSHFAVHVSPVYYLWLPLYALWPKPETLQVLQIVTVASGVIPLYLIAKDLGLDRTFRHVLVLVYVFHPALIGSSMYDVHENAFLAPLLLWLLYAAQTRRRVWFFIFVVLTLAVKEDAVLYVISAGLFLLWSKHMKLPGLISIVLALLWFFAVSRFLSNAGEGVMTYRFRDLMTYQEWGLPGVLYTVAVNPGYVFSEMFSAEKIHYLQKVLLPLAGLPLLQRRLSNLTLLLPLIVMNLASRYMYQADIGFQYHYGSGVLLFYLAILHLSDDAAYAKRPAVNRPHVRRYAVISLMLTAAVLFGGMLVSHYSWPLAYMRSNAVKVSEMKAAMDTIPPDASVRATTFLTTYLSDRPFIIDLGYEALDDADARQADYLVFDRRRPLGDDLETRYDDALNAGYAISAEVENGVVILKFQPE